MKKNSTALLLLGLMGFLSNGDVYSAAPMLIDIAGDLQISLSSASLSVTAYMLAFGIFTLIIGPLGDRFGKSKIVIISSFGTALFSCLSIFANNLPQLIVLRLINGAFAAGIMPVSMAIIGEIFDDSKRQNAIAKLMGMMFLGGAAGTAIGGILSYVGSWKMVYFAYGIAELILAVLLVFTLEKRSGTVGKLNYFKLYRAAFKKGDLLRLMILIIVTGFCILGSFTFTGDLMKGLTNLNVLQIGLLLTLFGIGGILGSRLLQKLSHLPIQRFCLIAGVIGAVSMFGLTLSGNIILLSLSIFGFGMGFIFLQSTLVAKAQSLMPKIKGTIMALVSFSVFFGSGIGTMVNNKIIDSMGISLVFHYSSLLFLGVGIFAFFIIKAQGLKPRLAKEGA